MARALHPSEGDARHNDTDRAGTLDATVVLRDAALRERSARAAVDTRLRLPRASSLYAHCQSPHTSPELPDWPGAVPADEVV